MPCSRGSLRSDPKFVEACRQLYDSPFCAAFAKTNFVSLVLKVERTELSFGFR